MSLRMPPRMSQNVRGHTYVCMPPGPGWGIRNGQNERRAQSRISQSVLKRARSRARFLQQIPLGNPSGNFFQKILLVRRELDKCIFQAFLSQKYFLRKKANNFEKSTIFFLEWPRLLLRQPLPPCPPVDSSRCARNRESRRVFGSGARVLPRFPSRGCVVVYILNGSGFRPRGLCRNI